MFVQQLKKIDSFECNQSEIQFVEWQSILNSVNSVYEWLQWFSELRSEHNHLTLEN